MTINRHNYEGFFLLYVDDELTVNQRAEIETFLNENPDLKEEMLKLQHTIFSGDEDVVFDNKQVLYKTAHGISLSNYEEYFLLHVDDELSPEQKNEVEKFVLQHPQLQDAFTQLRAAKLQPEVIEFSNKQSLYRQEKVRRVIPFNLVRMAAAAAVIGLITTLWITFGDNKTVPVNKNIVQQKFNAQPPVNVLNDVAKVEKEKKPSSYEDKVSGHLTKIEKEAITSSPKSSAQKIINTPPGKSSRTKINETPVEEKSLLASVDIVHSYGKKTSFTEMANENANGSSITQPTLLSNTGENKFAAEQAVYRAADNEEEDDNTLYIGGAEINKNKLRGLFKKATGIFEKKSRKSDKENIVQVASFEIKTK